MATIDLEDIRSYRNQIRSRSALSGSSKAYPRIVVDFSLSDSGPAGAVVNPTIPIVWQYHTPQEEIALGPACWLWDYLRLAQFFLGSSLELPLSSDFYEITSYIVSF